MVYGERVRHARQLRGLTQTELARRVGVSQPTIALIESGRDQPSDDVLASIALQTGFPPAFFRQVPSDHFSVGSLLFRARASATATEKMEAHRYAQTVFEIVRMMAAKLEIDPPRIPQLQESPVVAAQLTRAALGESSDRPILHLVHAIERAGGLVLAIPSPLERRDAFSLWAGERLDIPVIAVVADRPGDRQRFSVAHELGHLVLHGKMAGTIAEIESEADEFAAELLLPSAGIREEIVPPVTLFSLSALKRRWRVSIQALVRRARDLALISERQYRYLFEQMSARGWRTNEPAELGIPVEKPRAVRKMAELLYGTPIDYKRLASDASLTVQMVQEVIESHADRAEMSVVATQPRNPETEVISFHKRGRDATHKVTSARKECE